MDPVAEVLGAGTLLGNGMFSVRRWDPINVESHQPLCRTPASLGFLLEHLVPSQFTGNCIQHTA